MLNPTIDDMVAWFLANYEHPAENTPVDDGAYVYIWGEPVDATEVLTEQFGEDETTAVLIALAVERLVREHDVYEWVPVVPRDDFEIEP